MATWEEIRDIIEDNIYTGEGTTLGVTDAAKAIAALCAAVDEANHRTEAVIKLYETIWNRNQIIASLRQVGEDDAAAWLEANPGGTE